MRVYKFLLTIREGNDEFWEEIGDTKSGCDTVQEAIESCLDDQGWLMNGTVELLGYTKED